MEAMNGFHRWGGQQRRITDYSSSHEILLVGEGDFSFSLCLAIAFTSATNIVATSLDTYADLLMKYPNARENLAMLSALGASLFHGVDATKMSDLYFLNWKKYHRIIFNFPHVGFLGKEDNPDLIEKHRNLVRGFLMNASRMLWLNGEIHVRHKITAPFNSWKIEDLASECSLLFVGQEMFRIRDYPGYENKRGSGLKPNQPFPLGECRTFIFKLDPSLHQNLELGRNPVLSPAMSCNTEIPVNVQQQPVPSPLQPLLSSLNTYASNERSMECQRIFGQYLHHVEETFGSTSYDVRQSVLDALRLGLETYVSAAPWRPLSEYISILEELHRMSLARSKRLREMLTQLC